ncbi:MAG: hypothetical protein KHZ62_01850 [Clostridiales bacterium]|nr:hypothetical protein [Clostridiales bacterium]
MDEMLSKLVGALGQNSADFQSMEKAVRMIKNMQKINQLESKEEGEEHIDLAQRRMKILSAAMPYLSPSGANALSTAMRIMEIRRISTEKLPSVKMQEGLSDEARRRELLRAVIPYLSSEEKKQILSAMRLMEIAGG